MEHCKPFHDVPEEHAALPIWMYDHVKCVTPGTDEGGGTLNVVCEVCMVVM